jgi:hypothetical protein
MNRILLTTIIIVIIVMTSSAALAENNEIIYFPVIIDGSESYPDFECAPNPTPYRCPCDGPYRCLP